jgi:ComF family protein
LDLLFSSWLRGWLAPSACLACDRLVGENQFLCKSCEWGIEEMGQNHCACCAEPFSTASLSSHLCGKCLKKKPLFSKVWASLVYRGPTMDLIHGVKFGENPLGLKALIPRALPVFSRACREFAPEEILPVPLSPWRRFGRGFNQSFLLAHYLLKAERNKKNKIPLRRWVRRSHTRAQARQGRDERMKSLNQAFSIPRPSRVQNKRILLVDDVLTTGATAEALSRCLLKAGAKEVGVYVLARTPKAD